MVSITSIRHYGQRCGQTTIPRCSSRRIGECLYPESVWIVAWRMGKVKSFVYVGFFQTAAKNM